MKKTFWIIFLSAALIVPAALWIASPKTSPLSPLVRFQVRKGASAKEIARDLKNQGLIRHPWAFLIWVKLGRHSAALHQGIYDISYQENGFSIYREIRQGPLLVRITFPEGWTSRQMAAQLDTRGVVSAAEFLADVEKEKREGYLFPDTYYFEQGTPAATVVSRMVERFKQKAPPDMTEQARILKLTAYKIIILASLVEREARVPAERPVIAGVFYNRLRQHWLLESCATVEYSLGGWKPHLTYKDLEVNSPYNTYKHPGLPPGPICNPGAAALQAAAHPAKTDMMFFVADGQGTHRFSRYYKEHLAAQRKR